MKRSTRIFLTISALLILASLGTCFFGQRYAVNQIPAETLSQMEDDDWIGVEWMERGMYVFIFAVLVGLIPLIRAIVNSFRRTVVG
ncbi:MAG TPA: hypothetical protein VNO50_10620 [Pyrinomonadaceae bacterium]|nr:hypothetical protein [Pyrinomonadaceae bacterium]